MKRDMDLIRKILLALKAVVYDLRFLKYQSITMTDRKSRPTTIVAVWFMARL